MIKMASGVAAKAIGPRGFMLVMMTLVAIGFAAAFWMSYMTTPLWIWLGVNGVLALIFAIICSILCILGDFDWRDIDRPSVVWALMAEWSDGGQPSWLRLIVWILMIPTELVATLVLRPITLAVRALLNPMPGEWD